MIAPLLVLGYGNPARGDDGLGPAFVEHLASRAGAAVARGDLALLAEVQLQPEHALDLVGRRCVVFVDASAAGDTAVELRPLTPARNATFTTHVLSPQAVLHVFATIEGAPPPEAWLLAIRGERFGLGDAMSAAGRRNLEAALSAFTARWGVAAGETGRAPADFALQLSLLPPPRCA